MILAKYDNNHIDITESQVMEIEELLYYSTLDEFQKEFFLARLSNMTSEEAVVLVDMLQRNQLQGIDLPNPSQTDINRHLRKLK